MSLDYSKLSKKELEAIANDDYSQLSVNTLRLISMDKKDFSAKKTIENIPSSAVAEAKNYANIVLHPIETVTTALDIGAGALQNVLPQKVVDFVNQADANRPEALKRVSDSRKLASDVGQYYKDRFGGLENIKQSIQQDPVGVLGDVSALFTGGAGLTGKIGSLKRITSPVGKVGAAIDPLNLAVNTLGYGVSKVLPSSVPASLYSQAAKWQTSDKFTLADKARLTEVALKEQLMPNYAGVGKAQIMTSELGKTIDSLVASSTNSGIKVPATEIFKYIDEARNKLGGPKIEAAQDLAEINRIEKQFKAYLRKNKYTDLTPEQLQSFKQNVYKKVDYDKNNQRATMAREEVYKGMGRAAKEALEQNIPAIKELNKKQGALIELMPHLSKSASRIENRDIFNVNSGLKASAGGIIGGPVGAGIGFFGSLIDAPTVKARAALSLSKKQRQGIGMFYDNSPTASLMRQLLEEQGAYGSNVDSLLY